MVNLRRPYTLTEIPTLSPMYADIYKVNELVAGDCSS